MGQMYDGGEEWNPSPNQDTHMSNYADLLGDEGECVGALEINVGGSGRRRKPERSFVSSLPFPYAMAMTQDPWIQTILGQPNWRLFTMCSGSNGMRESHTGKLWERSLRMFGDKGYRTSLRSFLASEMVC